MNSVYVFTMYFPFPYKHNVKWQQCHVCGKVSLFPETYQCKAADYRSDTLALMVTSTVCTQQYKSNHNISITQQFAFSFSGLNGRMDFFWLLQRLLDCKDGEVPLMQVVTFDLRMVWFCSSALPPTANNKHVDGKHSSGQAKKRQGRLGRNLRLLGNDWEKGK